MIIGSIVSLLVSLLYVPMMLFIIYFLYTRMDNKFPLDDKDIYEIYYYNPKYYEGLIALSYFILVMFLMYYLKIYQD